MADIIPTAEMVVAVQDHIDSVKPVTAVLVVFAPTPVPLDLVITALDPDTDAVRAAIEAEIADLLRRAAAPGATILRSHITEAISLAAGERDHTLAAPAGNVTHQPHEIAVAGAITWPEA